MTTLAVNATYERGPDNSIKLIIIGEAQEETDTTVIDEEGNHYQPLVQNTVIRDASGMQPVYQELDKTQSKADHPVTSERYSMAKYQSLHRPEHSANDYQTLEQMKTGKQVRLNLQVLAYRIDLIMLPLSRGYKSVVLFLVTAV